MITTSLLLQLLSNAVTLRRDKSILYSRAVINVLLYSVFSYYFMKKIAKAIGLFGGLFHASALTKVYHIFFYVICAIILQLTAYYPRKIREMREISFLKSTEELNKISREHLNILLNKGQALKNNLMLSHSYSSFIINKMSEQFKILEYSLIILFIIIGAILLMSSSDLISMFLAIELQSYGLYIISTIYKNSELATKGGLTYFLLGGLSSCFILLGSCLLYSNTATTNLDGIYVITSLTGSFEGASLLSTAGDSQQWLGIEKGLETQVNVYQANYINVSLIIMTVGFLFKVSAAPFHFWSPDVYDAIPTIVTTFVAIVAKISIFIFLLELIHYTGKNMFALDFSWVNSLLVSSLLSLIVGTVLGLTQTRIKRLFAYSTISHIGFILLALSIDSVESIQAFLFYLIQYSLSNLNAFIILLGIGYSYYLVQGSQENKSEKANISQKFSLESLDQNNSPIQLTKQIKGLFFFNPLLALSLTITIFSFVGIPPLVGFFGKQMVLSAALDSGYYFITMVAILTSVISAVYYLNIIKEMFFFKSLSSFYPYNNLKSLLGFSSKEKIQITPDYASSINSNNYISDKGFTTINRQSLIPVIRETFVLSSYLTITISVLTLGILLFIFTPQILMSITRSLACNIYNT